VACDWVKVQYFGGNAWRVKLSVGKMLKGGADTVSLSWVVGLWGCVSSPAVRHGGRHACLYDTRIDAAEDNGSELFQPFAMSVSVIIYILATA